jgi:carbon storage regulator CsrA
MLVLTRKNQQQIQIGNNIVVTILQVKGQTVRVGIEAPREVRVVRGEIADKDEKPKDHEHQLPAVEISLEEREVLMGAAHENVEASADSVTLRRVQPRGVTSDLMPEPGFTSPSTQTPSGPRGGERSASVSRRRVPSAVRSASSIRPPVRLGPTSLRALVARAR